MKRIIYLIFFLFFTQFKGYAQYLFPDWIVEELIAQGIPMYTTKSGVWEATVRRYTFHFEVKFDVSWTTTFSVSNTDIYYHGSNIGYQQYVKGINWFAYFGVLPGNSFTIKGSIIGQSIEDMSDIVLSPMEENDGIKTRNTKSYSHTTEESQRSEQPQSLLIGLQYEKATYQEQKINEFSIPFSYSKLDTTSSGSQRIIGSRGKIQYASISDIKKYHVFVSPFLRLRLSRSFEIGGISHAGLTLTSYQNHEVPTVTVLGAGGFASYRGSIENLSIAGMDNITLCAGLLIEPKYGDGGFGIPIIYGFRIYSSFYNALRLNLEFIGGSDPMTETDDDNISQLDIRITILGIYSFGYQKVLNPGSFKNNLFYISMRQWL